MTVLALLLLAAALLPGTQSIAGSIPTAGREEKGLAHFVPLGDDGQISCRYRMRGRDFAYTTYLQAQLPNSGVEMRALRFASPVMTDCLVNNTVQGVYYRPAGPGPFPAVVVLDISSGTQQVASAEAVYLARKGVAALCMHLPYYGPRRPAGSSLRLVSPDYRRSMAAVRQAVLDVRCAVAWLAGKPEIDPRRLGIMGTSLGSFVGALAAEMEPRVANVVILLGGGGLVDGYYDDPRAEPLRALWEALGGSRRRMAELVAPADPLTWARNLRGRHVLMIAGRWDQIVPPAMVKRLWEGAGRPELVWLDCDHFGAALYFEPAMRRVVKHLAAPATRGPTLTPGGPSGGDPLP